MDALNVERRLTPKEGGIWLPRLPLGRQVGSGGQGGCWALGLGAWGDGDAAWSPDAEKVPLHQVVLLEARSSEASLGSGKPLSQIRRGRQILLLQLCENARPSPYPEGGGFAIQITSSHLGGLLCQEQGFLRLVHAPTIKENRTSPFGSVLSSMGNQRVFLSPVPLGLHLALCKRAWCCILHRC